MARKNKATSSKKQQQSQQKSGEGPRRINNKNKKEKKEQRFSKSAVPRIIKQTHINPQNPFSYAALSTHDPKENQPRWIIVDPPFSQDDKEEMANCLRVCCVQMHLWEKAGEFPQDLELVEMKHFFPPPIFVARRVSEKHQRILEELFYGDESSSSRTSATIKYQKKTTNHEKTPGILLLVPIQRLFARSFTNRSTEDQADLIDKVLERKLAMMTYKKDD